MESDTIELLEEQAFDLPTVTLDDASIPNTPTTSATPHPGITLTVNLVNKASSNSSTGARSEPCSLNSDDSWDLISHHSNTNSLSSPPSINGDNNDVVENSNNSTLLALVSDTEGSIIKTNVGYSSDDNEDLANEELMRGERSLHFSSQQTHNDDDDNNNSATSNVGATRAGNYQTYGFSSVDEAFQGLPILSGGLLALKTATETSFSLFSHIAAGLHALYSHVHAYVTQQSPMLAATVKEMAEALHVNVRQGSHSTVAVVGVTYNHLSQAIHGHMKTIAKTTSSLVTDSKGHYDWSRITLLTALSALSVLYLRQCHVSRGLAASLVEKDVELADMVGRYVELQQRYVSGAARHVPVFRHTSCSMSAWPVAVMASA